jgi:hypothetical protein
MDLGDTPADGKAKPHGEIRHGLCAGGEIVSGASTFTKSGLVPPVPAETRLSISSCIAGLVQNTPYNTTPYNMILAFP